MKPARLVILVVAVGAAASAAFLMTQEEAPKPQVVVEKAPAIQTVDVLVAGSDLPVGQTLRPEDLRWQPWPRELAPTGSLQRDQAPDALGELTGAIARQSLLAGEPIRREKLVRADGSGFMSAILPSGRRAVAISIDAGGATTAGGFILPNDRVDVLRTRRDEEAGRSGGDAQVTETLLTNLRVLAIGQKVQEMNGEKVVTGSTATLEVSPAQAETLTLAQRVGQLSLVLRSLADAKGDEPKPEVQASGQGLTVVRYGVGRSETKR